mmetsp:Transcript_992/g.2870  ORF Transcript_992/g.2870 Transcript_992/m.2870 type:complete len:200 (+) Transcript_992:1237-1836(+)
MHATCWGRRKPPARSSRWARTATRSWCSCPRSTRPAWAAPCDSAPAGRFCMRTRMDLLPLRSSCITPRRVSWSDTVIVMKWTRAVCTAWKKLAWCSPGRTSGGSAWRSWSSSATCTPSSSPPSSIRSSSRTRIPHHHRSTVSYWPLRPLRTTARTWSAPRRRSASTPSWTASTWTWRTRGGRPWPSEHLVGDLMLSWPI